MNDIQQHASLYMIKLRSISTAREWRALRQDILSDFSRLMVQRGSLVKPPVGEEEMHRRRHDNGDGGNIWMSRTVFYMYAIAALALLTHRLWILHGISILILDKIMEVSTKWIVYTLDDKELRYACKYIRGWLELFLREGEEILTGEAAWKFAMTYTIIAQAPTGISYVRYFIHYKMIESRREFMQELGINRFGTIGHGYIQRKLTELRESSPWSSTRGVVLGKA